MANTKISALPANNNPTGDEELVYALNNANGKMTLNTMKTFASADSQPELVSGVNIKTINGDSILGSGNLVVQGGGGGGGDSSFDAIVDAGGEGDYTLVSAAIAAGKYNIFVKNGNYTETAGWNPYSNSASYLHIVGESESGVNITFPSTTTTANGILIDMRYNNAADFYMENMSFDITLTNTNATFYKDSGGTNFIVKNCSFTYDTEVETPSNTKHYLFYSKVVADANTETEGGRVYSGLYGCYFNTETTKIINIGYRLLAAYMCKFYSYAGRIQFVGTSYVAKLYNCFVNTYDLGGASKLESYNSYINIEGNIRDTDGTNILTARVLDESTFKVGTLQTTPSIILGRCVNSVIDLGAYNNGTTTDAIFTGDTITCGQFTVQARTAIGCIISASTLNVVGGRVEGNRFTNTLTGATIGTNSIVNGNTFLSSSGTVTISGDDVIFTSNHMASMTLTDSGTGTQKANNITAA